MRPTSYIKSIPLSFFSKNFYREVAGQWHGLGFVYLMFVHMLIGLPLLAVALYYTSSVTLEKPYNFNNLINQIPPITIENGNVQVAAEQPYYMYDTNDGGKLIGIIDTTRPVTDYMQVSGKYFAGGSSLLKDGGFVLGKENFMIYSANQQKHTVRKITAENMVITADSVRNFLNEWLPYGWVIGILAYLAGIVLLALYRLVWALGGGLFALLVNRTIKAPLNYQDCVRLSALALTPVILANAALMWFISVPFWVSFTALTMYISFALKANAN